MYVTPRNPIDNSSALSTALYPSPRSVFIASPATFFLSQYLIPLPCVHPSCCLPSPKVSLLFISLDELTREFANLGIWGQGTEVSEPRALTTKSPNEDEFMIKIFYFSREVPACDVMCEFDSPVRWTMDNLQASIMEMSIPLSGRSLIRKGGNKYSSVSLNWLKPFPAPPYRQNSLL